jgi:hypothetical protein
LGHSELTMGISFAQLKLSPLRLSPVEVPITGLEEPLMIHQFTLAESLAIDELTQGEDPEVQTLDHVLMFLNGIEYVPNPDDRDALKRMFASWQIREIYSKAMKLNGMGPEALRDAQKN